jgi:prepilin-type N-terminal cleavage/methylation domain-containing protein
MGRMNRKVSGFTLMELIIVIAIIGILAGILAPTMSTYYKKSRVKDANADAKMVCNAAQTEVQKYLSIDRSSSTNSLFASDGIVISYRSDGTISYSKNDLTSALVSVAATTTNEQEQQILSVVERVNTTVSDAENINWAIYVDGYIVKASVSATATNTNYVGKYSVKSVISTDPDSKTYANFVSSGTELAALAADYDAWDPATT